MLWYLDTLDSILIWTSSVDTIEFLNKKNAFLYQRSFFIISCFDSNHQDSLSIYGTIYSSDKFLVSTLILQQLSKTSNESFNKTKNKNLN